MKTLLNYIYLTYIVIAMVCMPACSGGVSDKLDAARQLADARPDSAYIILREIDYNDLDADSLKAKYILTRAMANLRIGRSLITDTLLNDAATYYISVGDTTDWVLASQMLAGYEFISGDPEAALRRLSEMLPRIKNPELIWDTYLHLYELSFNSQDYTAACNYADWLLRHTNIPEQQLRFTVAKSGSCYYRGEFETALAICDSIISSGLVKRVKPEVAREFYEEYAEFLNNAGQSMRAINIIDSIHRDGVNPGNIDRFTRDVSLAQFYANAGNLDKAKALLDSLNPDEVQSIPELYAGAGMLKAAVEYRFTGRFPSELMHKVTKTLHRNYSLSQFDRQTAMESVIELNEDKSALQIQKQRLWMIVLGVLLIAVIGSVTVFIILLRRKQRLIEAEERIEALDRMVKDANQADKTDKEAVLKRMVLQQMGILKTFASAPTTQNEDALRKISNVGFTSDSPNRQLVDWDNLYTLVDELFDGFHVRLIKHYTNLFTDKEIQLICLLKADFSTKEIGFLTGQSSASVYVRKSAIRKKLGTVENGDFMAQIESAI